MTTIDDAAGAPQGVGALGDAELVLRSRSGDRAAYGELWRRHYPAGVSVARSFTGSIDADDLVQEAYAQIYQSILRGGGPTASFRAYLFTSIRNTAAGWGRARKETAVDLLDTVEDPATSEQATSDALDRSITAQAFKSLPSRWQEVLWYSEIEQLKPAEIAPLLGMKAAAVAQLAFRAREGLREAWIQAHLRTVADGSDCQWTISHLGAYARGNLGRRDHAKLQSHLGGCARCTIVAGEAKDVSRRLALVLLPLTIGITGTAAYLATLQGGGVPIVALAAMPSGLVPGAVTVTGSAAGAGAGAAGAGAAGAGAAGAGAAGAGAVGAGAGAAGAAGAGAAGAAGAGAGLGAGAAGASAAGASAAGASAAGVAATVGTAGAAGMATAGAAATVGAAATTATTAAVGGSLAAATGGLLSGIGATVSLVAAGTVIVGSVIAGALILPTIQQPADVAASTSQSTTDTGQGSETAQSETGGPVDADATDPAAPEGTSGATTPDADSGSAIDGTSSTTTDGTDAAAGSDGQSVTPAAPVTPPGNSGNPGQGTPPSAPVSALPGGAPAFGGASAGVVSAEPVIYLALSGQPGATVQTLVNGSVKATTVFDGSGAGSASVLLTRGLVESDARLQLRYVAGAETGATASMQLSALVDTTALLAAVDASKQGKDQNQGQIPGHPDSPVTPGQTTPPQVSTQSVVPNPAQATVADAAAATAATTAVTAATTTASEPADEGVATPAA